MPAVITADGADQAVKLEDERWEMYSHQEDVRQPIQNLLFPRKESLPDWIRHECYQPVP